MACNRINVHTRLEPPFDMSRRNVLVGVRPWWLLSDCR
jgi:hypothetical protein